MTNQVLFDPKADPAMVKAEKLRLIVQARKDIKLVSVQLAEMGRLLGEAVRSLDDLDGLV